jgi:hypothetical protein
MNRKLLAVLATGAVLGAGGYGIAALASSVATHTACATATVPPHTLADNGTNIYTIPGASDTRCVTATDSTVTATTTTAGTTTTPPPATSLDALGGLAIYVDTDYVKARDLVGEKYVRRDWPSASSVAAAKAAGIQLLPVADYAHGHGTVDHAPPTDLAGWIAELKADYVNDWQSPPAVEIWNEPWLTSFWQPTPNPTAYLNLVKNAAAALWSINPNVRILVSLDTNGSTNTTGTNVWRKNVLAADTGKFLTDPRIRPTTHNYVEGRTPTTVTSQPCSWDFNRYDCAYNDLKAFGHPDPQVWVTEYGWEVNEGTHYYGTVTEAQQADYVTQGIELMQASGHVEHAYAFFLKTNESWSYNWLDLANQPRDVCAAVKALLSGVTTPIAQATTADLGDPATYDAQLEAKRERAAEHRRNIEH